MKHRQAAPSENTVPPVCRECMKYANCQLAPDENLRQTCSIIRDDGKLSYFNHEGYRDPTAFQAMRNIGRKHQKKTAEEKTRPPQALPPNPCGTLRLKRRAR